MDQETKLKIIVNVLSRHDPAGIITGDSSTDEYEPEAKAILAKWHSSISLEALSQVINDVFVSFFDKAIAGSAEDYVSIAQDILEA